MDGESSSPNLTGSESIFIWTKIKSFSSSLFNMRINSRIDRGGSEIAARMSFIYIEYSRHVIESWDVGVSD